MGIERAVDLAQCVDGRRPDRVAGLLSASRTSTPLRYAAPTVRRSTGALVRLWLYAYPLIRVLNKTGVLGHQGRAGRQSLGEQRGLGPDLSEKAEHTQAHTGGVPRNLILACNGSDQRLTARASDGDGTVNVEPLLNGTDCLGNEAARHKSGAACVTGLPFAPINDPSFDHRLALTVDAGRRLTPR